MKPGIFQFVKNTVWEKIKPVFTKLRQWLTPSYIRSRFLAGLRSRLQGLFSMKPKNRDDYYPVGPLLLSKKLAMTLMLVLVLLLGTLITWSIPVRSKDGDRTYVTYRYNSILLKFATGQIKILGKSGYTAYAGSVKNGVVKGKGTLYRKDQSLAYEGEFDRNMYNGKGRLYYPGGALEYEGEFVNNLYSGSGALFRSNGTKEYEGGFLNGKKSGSGTAYGDAGEEVYTGNWVSGEVMLQDMLGLKTTEAAKKYSGRRILYQGQSDLGVYMKDLNAFYVTEGAEQTLEEEQTISGIYKMQDFIVLDGKEYHSISDIRAKMDATLYEGNSNLTEMDQIVLNQMTDGSDATYLFGRAGLELSSDYEDAFTVSSSDPDYVVYLYSFEKDHIRYHFFCTDKNAGFAFYLMEKE